MTEKAREMLHATALAIDDHGILLTGESGIGKSDLALRLIDRGAILISDDVVHLETQKDKLVLHTPPAIAGKIEIRSLGIVDIPYTSAIDLVLKIRLIDPTERYPLDRRVETILETPIATVAIAPKEASAPIKVEFALKHALESKNQL